MKKISLLMSLILVMTSLFTVAPAAAAGTEVGPWIADFSEMTSEAGKQLENNGCYLNMADTNNWIYDSEGDYVNTNAQSADLRIGEQYAEDYTIGFKMNAQTQGNLRLQLYGQLDNSTKGSSASISKPEAFDFHEKIREVQPEGGRSLLFVHRVNTIDFTNSVEKAGVQEKTTITKNIKSGTWVDMRVEIDFSDDANSDVLFTAKTYMNNEYVSCIEIPRYVVTKFSGSFYWAKIISPAFFPVNSGKNTLIKDMYMYSGIENKSIIPESFVETVALVDEDFSKASSGDELDVATKGTEAIYNDGYATISYTSDGNANVTGSPTIGIASPSVVNNHFIYSLKFKCDDFYTERYLFNSNINGVTTNPLRIDTSIRDGVTRNGADLRLVNYDANSKAYDVATCRIVKGQWYSAQIIGKRDSSGKMSFDVTVKNVATNEILMNATMTDEREGTLSGAIPWKIVAGTKAELNALPAGTTSSFSVDDVYFAKVLDACEISDVKLFQGMDFLADQYELEEDIKVNVMFSNNMQSAKAVTLYVAEYNRQKELLQIVPVTKTIEAAEVQGICLNPDRDVLSAKLTPSADSSMIECFFWDGNAGSIAPMSKQITINCK